MTRPLIPIETVIIHYIPYILILSLWEGVWKAIALWKAAKNEQLSWYICILIFNTVGILPILYIKFFQRKRLPL
jgi:hypothetical protein